MSPRIFLSLLSPLLFLSLHAEHLAGGSITYTCQGNNFYEIRLSLIRECSETPMTPQRLDFESQCGITYHIDELQPVSVEDISQICPAQVQNSTCEGGPLPGYRLYHFTVTTYLSPCDHWRIFWSTCCRQSTLNVGTGQGLYMETFIYNLTSPCSSSPVFNNNSVPHLCVGQSVVFDSGATDVDGHAMLYTFIDARVATPFPISLNYLPPHYGGIPFTGMTLDPATGQISFTPTEQGIVIVVVQVEEFDENGALLGMVLRDFPFVIYACDNAPPEPASGTITSSTGGATATGSRTMRLCNGSDGCVVLEFNDPDAGQSVSLASNVADVLPGAGWVVTGGEPAVGTICWTTVDIPAGTYQFTVMAMDDHCPFTGNTSYLYTVFVDDPKVAGEDGTATACVLTLPFALIDSLPGTPPPGGEWTDPQSAPHSGIFNNQLDGPGTYTYTAGSGDCTAIFFLEIEFLQDADPLCIISTVEERNLAQGLLHPNPTTGSLLMNSMELQGHVLVTDRLGRVVQEFTPQLQRQSIDLSPALPDGVYMLRVMDRDGSTGRHFILQR